MSIWWIGVNEQTKKMSVFEATSEEAYSEEFESTYGIAFGMYRSKEQAEADIKNQAKHLLEQAKKERGERKIPAESTRRVVKSGKNLHKSAEKPLKTLKPAELSASVEYMQVYMHALRALEDLKIAIIRAVEMIKLLKERLEEANDKNRS